MDLETLIVHLKLVIINKDNQLLTNYIRTKIFLILLGGFLFSSITFAQSNIDLWSQPPKHAHISSDLNGRITLHWSHPFSDPFGNKPRSSASLNTVIGEVTEKKINFHDDICAINPEFCKCRFGNCNPNKNVTNLEYIIEESINGGAFSQIHRKYIGSADIASDEFLRYEIQRNTGNYKFRIKAKYDDLPKSIAVELYLEHVKVSPPNLSKSADNLTWSIPSSLVSIKIEYAECNTACGSIPSSQWKNISPTTNTSLLLIPFNLTHTVFRAKYCKSSRLCTAWSSIYKYGIPKAQLTLTWVPIAVGDITTFIPVGDASATPEDYNIQLSERDGNRYVTWSTQVPATRFEIQGLNSQGQWVTVTDTENYGVLLDSSYSQFTKIRVLACNGNVCGRIGNSPDIGISKRSIVFIHTDLLGSPVAETDIDGKVL